MIFILSINTKLYRNKREGERERERGREKFSCGYRATLLTLQVGSRGVPHYESFADLARVLKMSNKDLLSLVTNTAKAAIQGLFKIWCSRNKSS